MSSADAKGYLCTLAIVHIIKLYSVSERHCVIQTGIYYFG